MWIIFVNPSIHDSFVLIGDFNVDCFCTNSFLYRRLKDSLSPFSLHQVVQSATHVSPSCTSSLIDFVFMSNLSQLSSCSVVPPMHGEF